MSTAIRYPNARVPKWTPRIAKAVRICKFRVPVFEAGDSFSGRPKLHFTQQQLERELTEADFSITTFYVWADMGRLLRSRSVT